MHAVEPLAQPVEVSLLRDNEERRGSLGYSVRIVSNCSLVIPVPSVALLIAPMAAPATPPITGTKNSAPSTRPQSAPQPVDCQVSSCPCVVSAGTRQPAR